MARSAADEADVAVAKGSQLDVEMHCRLGEGMAVAKALILLVGSRGRSLVVEVESAQDLRGDSYH